MEKSRHILFEALEPRIMLSADGLLNAIITDQDQDTLPDGMQQLIQYAELLDTNEQAEVQISLELAPSDTTNTNTEDCQPIFTLLADDDNINEEPIDADLSVDNIEPHQVNGEIAVLPNDFDGDIVSKVGTTEDSNMPTCINDADLSAEYATSIEIRGPPLSETVNSKIATYCPDSEDSEVDHNILEEFAAELQTDGALDLPGMHLVDPAADYFDGQIFYLNFCGEQDVTYNGPVVVEGIDIPEFSTEAAGLAGQESVIISQILSVLEHEFEGTGVLFTTSKPDPSISYSTIFVGGNNNAFSHLGDFYGVAEQVDIGNQNCGDDAFVFSESISSGAQNARQYVAVLTGLIAHEAGHLLGYAHNYHEFTMEPLVEVAALLSITDDFTAFPGDTLTVPIHALANADGDVTGFMGGGIDFSYDTDVFFDLTYADLAVGDLLSGWSLTSNTTELGLVQVAMWSSSPLSGGSGSVLEIDFSVRPDAPLGPTTIDLLETSSFNEGELVLTLDDGTVTVIAQIEAPVAVDDTYSTNEDTPLTVTTPGVLGNDIDYDGDALTAVLDTDVSNGTLTLNADGSFTYSPYPDFNGTDSFTYHAHDGALDSNVATVTILVSWLYEPPVALDDAYTTAEDTPLVIAGPGVLGNDIYFDGDALTADLYTNVSNGTLTLNADGSFNYSPDANYHGTDSFIYEACDYIGLTDIATVTVTVNPVNDPPVAQIDNITPNPAEDLGQMISFEGTGTDVDGFVVEWEWTSNLDGLLSNAEDFSISSNDLRIGTHEISFRVKDNDGLWSDPATGELTIIITADTIAPTADLSHPMLDASISQWAINSSERYIDVTFTDTGGSGLDLSTITDSGQEFTLGGVAASGVTVDGSPTLQTGMTYRYFFTGDFGTGPVDVNFIAGSWADNASNVNAAETESFTVLSSFGEIRGSKWNDLDGDREWDAGEPRLEGWTIYLDENNNGQLDAGEVSTTTDASGAYSFPGLTSGTYTVAEVLQNGWMQTFPGKSLGHWVASYVETFSDVYGNAIAVGDGNNDGEVELYASAASNIFQYKWDGSNWLKLTIASVGDSSTHIVVGDGDNDGLNEVYITGGGDQNLYELEFDGSAWMSTVVGSTSGTNRRMITVVVGDGDNDGLNEVYGGDGIYQNGYLFEYEWSGSGWIETQIDYAGSMNYIALADGDNDGFKEIYVNTGGHKDFGPEWDSVHEYTWTGSSWSDYVIFENPWRAAYGLTVGDPDNDGSSEVYFTDVGGGIMQAVWNGSSWSHSPIAGSGWGTIRDVAIGDADNDGSNELYTAGYGMARYVFNGLTWDREYIHPHTNANYSRVVVADCDSDGENEIYIIEEVFIDDPMSYETSILQMQLAYMHVVELSPGEIVEDIDFGNQPSQRTIYVDDDATSGANNGTSWTNAFIYLQDALSFAENLGGEISEILVAEGIYKPDQGAAVVSGDRTATFQLLNGVSIQGGYAGLGAPDPNARDVGLYETVLSGDLIGDDGPNFANNVENSYHIVTGSGTDATAIFNGFTITSGNSDVSSPIPGASGMYNDSGSPTVENCTFFANSAHYGETRYLGGGMENHYSNPTVTNCTFAENVADYGGGMFNYNSNPTVTKCVFMGNQVKKDGGGLLNYFSSPILTNCTFRGNHARNSGGMENRSSSPEVTNCTFEENIAIYYGGGMTNWSNLGDCAPVLTGCTFSGNSAGKGGGGIHNGSNSSLTVQNCILWGDRPDEIFDYLSTTCTVTYSGVQGGWPGEGNIDADPLFVDPINSDYHLQPDSPCIDAGDNMAVLQDACDIDGDGNTTERTPLDLDGRDRFIDNPLKADTGLTDLPDYPYIVDMGAYEFWLIYVDDDAPGDPGPGDPSVPDPLEDGTQAHPFDSIQEAIDIAIDGDIVTVAEGTYYENINIDSKGIVLTSADPDNPTVVNSTVIDGGGSGSVVIIQGGTSGVTLTGLTITGGSRPSSIGGGIRIGSSAPVNINKCNITGSNAIQGGGIFIDGSASLSLNKCNIIGNTAHNGGGIYLGSANGNVTISECLFSDNEAASGGAISGNFSNAVIQNCVFAYNSTTAWPAIGGALQFWGGPPQIASCTFVENSADRGGAIALGYSDTQLSNCIFWQNTASQGQQILLYSEYDLPATLLINYCNVQAGQSGVYADPATTLNWGEGNIDDDPCFADPNYHLLSNSPCIDAGDNTALPEDVADLDGDGDTTEPIPFDFDGNPRILNGVVDMGAYELSDTIAPMVQDWALLKDTGISSTDKLTNDSTPQLTFTFSEHIFGNNSDIEVLDPDSNPMTPDSISGWGSDTLVIVFSTPLLLDGEYTVTLNGMGTIEDEAGNSLNGGVDEVVTFTLDTTAPVVTVDLLVSNDPRPQLTGTVDDPAAVIEVTVDGNAYVATNNSDSTWTLADDTITPALVDRAYDISVSATDSAGNIGTDGTSDELIIDLNPVILLSVEPERTPGIDVQVQVQANESIAGVPSVTVRDSNTGLLSVTYEGEYPEGHSFTIDLAGAAEGIAEVEVIVYDLTGNVGYAASSFVIDWTPPMFEASLEGSLIGAGTHTLVVTPSELLAAAPAVTTTDSIGQPIEISAPTRHGSAYYYTLTVDENTGQGEAAFNVQGDDLTGNSGAYFGVFYVDSIAPTFTFSAPVLMDSGISHIIVTPDEVLPALPEVSVVSASMEAVEVQSPTFDGASYNYSVMVYSGTTNGSGTMAISICDAAGNVRSESQPVVIDTEPPELTIVVSPDPPTGAGSVSIQVSASEVLAAVPEILASLDGQTYLPVTLSLQVGNTYEWTCASDDVAVISVAAFDLAGNQTTETLTFADVSVDEGGLTLSGIPYTGNDVTAEAVINNTGQTCVENVLVRFYSGSLWSLEPLGSDHYVSLAAGESMIVSVLWPTAAQEDNSLIFVIVDPEDVLPETDELNNSALRGPVVVAQGLDRHTYLLTDTTAEAWALPYDSSDFRLLDDSETIIYIWIEDENGQVVAGPWAAGFDTVDERFELVFDPSQLISPGQYQLVAEASSTGLNFAPMSSRETFSVIRDFTVSLNPDQMTYERGELVMLSGSVLDAIGDPLANVAVSLTMTAQYGTRYFTVSTDLEGYYELPYQPVAQEAGEYEVIASVTQGEIFRESAPATFEIRGLYLQAAKASTRVLAGKQQSLTFRIWNLGTTPLDGLTVTLEDFGGTANNLGTILDLTGTATTLLAGEVTSFSVHLSAGQELGNRVLSIHVESASGSVEQAQLDVEVFGTDPYVVFNPPGLEVIVPNGGLLTCEVTIKNIGWHDVADAVLVDETPDWITIMGNPIIGTLPGNKGLSDEGFGLFDRFSLLGKVGQNGEIFQVGSDYTFSADDNGELYFRINEADTQISDNEGQLNLTIYIQGQTLAHQTLILADQGWQGTGLDVVGDQDVHVVAEGIWKTSTSAYREADGNGTAIFSILWAPDDPNLVTGQPNIWNIKVNGSNITERIMLLRTWVISDETASAHFAVTNPMGQPLEDAQVTLYSQRYDPTTQSYPIYASTSGNDGTVKFSGLPAGPYGYVVSMDEYLDVTGTFDVASGQVVTLDTVLDPQVVTVEWIITEIPDRPDHYEIMLRTEFKVAEPDPVMPILVGNPIRLAMEPGKVEPGVLTITNVGDLPAYDVNVNVTTLLERRGRLGSAWVKFLEVDNYGVTQLVSFTSIPSLMPGERVSLDYQAFLSQEVQADEVFSGYVNVDYGYVDANGLHTSKTAILVEISSVVSSTVVSSTVDDLARNPSVIYAFLRNDLSNIISFQQDLETPVRVTNIGYNNVTNVNGPWGALVGLVNVGVSLTDMIMTWLGAPFIPDILHGQFQPKPEPTSPLEPGEYITMNLVATKLLPDIGVSLASLSVGLAGFQADWSTAASPYTRLHYSYHFVPVIVVTLGTNWIIEPLLPWPDSTNGDPDSAKIGIRFPTDPIQVPEVIGGDDGDEVPSYVTFDIAQEVSFDRQAFTGTLKIHNGSELAPLENLLVNIEIADEHGNVISADHRNSSDFFVRVNDISGVSDIDGNGYLAAGENAVVEFLIIPTEQAGGRKFQLKARLDWVWAGVNDGVESREQLIDVRPQPYVQLDYFIQSQFETGEPFFLGVMATNTGEGIVRNLEIQSEQPEIYWPETDVVSAHVQIDEAFVSTSSGPYSTEGLTLDFGTLEPGHSASGWWTLRAWPGGTVTSFDNSSIKHDEELGGTKTSLLNESVGTHTINCFNLINNAPGGSGGILALVDWDMNGQPDTLLDTTDSSLYDVAVVASTITQFPTFGNYEMRIQFEKTEGWIYTEIPDPFGGSLEILEIQTSDGRILDPRNYWMANGMIHIVDDPVEEYIIVFLPDPSPETHKGVLLLDNVQYIGFDSVATVTLVDDDLDRTFGASNDVASIQIISDEDPTGETIILTETNEAGKFTGTFGFEPSSILGNGKISVQNRNLFTVIYDDENGADGSPVSVITKAQWISLSVDAGSDSAVDEGSTVTLMATFTDAPSVATHTAMIDWGDGTSDIGAVDELADTIGAVHVYANDGIYNVTVTVTGDDGALASDALMVIISNVAPVLDAGEDLTVDEDQVVTLDPATFNDKGTADTHTATINWGDGTATEAGLVTESPFGPPGSTSGADGIVSGSHVYADDATYTVTVTVMDSYGESDFDQFTITVLNVAPTLTLSGVGDVDEGSVYTLNLASDDPGEDTIGYWEINWGDGVIETVAGNPSSVDHVYEDGPNIYLISAQATDEDGTYSANTVEVTVHNVTPTIILTGPAGVEEGAAYVPTLGAVTDPGEDTVTEYIVHWGDGGTDTYSSGGDVTHVYADGPANHTIVVDLVDEDGTHPGSATLDVQVNNVAPSLDDATFDVEENSPNETMVGMISGIDPGNDTLTYSVVGGSGVTAFAMDATTGRIIVAGETQLDYETNPSFTFEVQAMDDDGATDTATVIINLLNQASITGSVFVDVNENGVYEANEPGIDSITIELLDKNGVPVLDAQSNPVTAITSDGGFYLFEDLDPGTYLLREVQPTGVDDGAEILGSLGGTIPANDTMRLTLERIDATDYIFAELGQLVASGDTATIGFWQNKHGQALIEQGGAALANWLTNNFGNVFGDTFVSGDGNDVASFYRDQLFRQKSQKSAGPAKVDAQFMAVALATYFTSSNLAGNVASAYGFNVTDTGIGTKLVNVGDNGTAFSVSNGTDLTIMQLLLATDNLTDQPDSLSGSARIYDLNGDGEIEEYEAVLRRLANDVFSSINEQGDI